MTQRLVVHKNSGAVSTIPAVSTIIVGVASSGSPVTMCHLTRPNNPDAARARTLPFSWSGARLTWIATAIEHERPLYFKYIRADRECASILDPNTSTACEHYSRCGDCLALVEGFVSENTLCLSGGLCQDDFRNECNCSYREHFHKVLSD
jgi:hypothetical protein